MCSFIALTTSRYSATLSSLFTSLEVHHLAMQLFSIPLGILAGSFVLKANQLTGPDLQSCTLKSPWLGCAVVAAAMCHIFLHLVTLQAIQRTCTTSVDRSDSKAKYEDIVDLFPASYFSLSPVNCLRSRYDLAPKTVEEFYSAYLSPRSRTSRSSQ